MKRLHIPIAILMFLASTGCTPEMPTALPTQTGSPSASTAATEEGQTRGSAPTTPNGQTRGSAPTVYPLPGLAASQETLPPYPAPWATTAPTLPPKTTVPLEVLKPSTATATPQAPSATPQVPQTVAPQLQHYPTAVPILYEMHDWENTDFQHAFPQWGPLGAWMWWPWSQIQPEAGRFNWAIIDEYLETASHYNITLRSGEVIPKPIAISIEVYPDKGLDATPSWVYDRFIPAALRLGEKRVGWIADPDGPEGPCPSLAVPRWGDPIWEKLFDEFVMALGKRYDQDPRVNSVWIATGLYGETVEEKTFDGCRYELGHGAALAKWVLHVMDTYRQAFPTKPLFIINSAGWGIRKDTAAKAATYNPPIGLKLNVLAPDLADAYGYKSLAGGGKIEIVNRYSDTLPIAFEHAFPSRPADTYWSIMNALAHRATLLDFAAPDMFSIIANLEPIFPLWKFIDEHLGREATTTPDVWILLRETYHPQSRYDGWASGEYGDWHFFLTRPEGIPENRTVAITETIAAALPAPARHHIYSYHSTRRTDQRSGNRYMSFDIDNRYPYGGQKPIAAGGEVGYKVQVILLNQGADQLALEYKNADGEWVTRAVAKGPGLGPPNDWVTVEWTLTDAYFHDNLPGGTDFRLDCLGDGDEYIHRVHVQGFRKEQ